MNLYLLEYEIESEERYAHSAMGRQLDFHSSKASSSLAWATN